MIPAWLRARIGRKAQLTVCPRCAVLLLVGLDADVAAIEARVEYVRLTAVGELLALADGRLTYNVNSRSGGRYELDPRDWRAIVRRPAALCCVVVEHRCGSLVPSQWRSSDRVLPGRDKRPEVGDVPQF